jgi:hypothetical protein
MKPTFQASLKDRSYLTPLVIGAVIVIILLIMGAFQIRPSEVQVPVRYTSFGITNFYRHQWFYQFTFLFFGLLVYVLHTMMGLKLYQKKGHEFAVAFQWLTVAILLMTLVTVGAIFKVADIV